MIFHSIDDRAEWMASEARGYLPVQGVWKNPTRLRVLRRYRPLRWGQADEGFRLRSLPGRPAEVVDFTSPILSYDAGKLRIEEGVREIGPGGGGDAKRERGS